MDEMQAAHL
jgi:regulator of replication initiation timing